MGGRSGTGGMLDGRLMLPEPNPLPLPVVKLVAFAVETFPASSTYRFANCCMTWRMSSVIHWTNWSPYCGVLLIATSFPPPLPASIRGAPRRNASLA